MEDDTKKLDKKWDIERKVPEWKGNIVPTEKELNDAMENNIRKVEYLENLIKGMWEKSDNRYKECYYLVNDKYSVEFNFRNKNPGEIYKTITIRNKEKNEVEYKIAYNDNELLSWWTVPSPDGKHYEQLDLATPRIYDEHLLNVKNIIRSVINW